MSEVVDRIRSRGYWDVFIHPEPFRKDQVPYGDLDGILNQAVVRFRGWPVPFINLRQPISRHQEWIGQDIEDQSPAHEEAWRFFTSGQFNQLRVISADWRTPVPRGATPAIETWEILFYLTEIVELAARLALTHAGSDQMTIGICLNAPGGRRLVAGTPQRMMSGDYSTSASCLKGRRTLQRDHLIAEARQIAVDMSKQMFQRFGFNASSEGLAAYQRELTDG